MKRESTGRITRQEWINAVCVSVLQVLAIIGLVVLLCLAAPALTATGQQPPTHYGAPVYPALDYWTPHFPQFPIRNYVRGVCGLPPLTMYRGVPYQQPLPPVPPPQ